MKKYIGGPSNINTMLFLLNKETQIGSKTVYLDAMQARVYFQPNILTKFEEIIAQYKAWNHYVTADLQVEANDMKFLKLKLDIFCLSY